jgi:hypothetical protein
MRWRRPVILIALLLLAGAVVNVAVAWVLLGAPHSWTLGSRSRVIPIGDPDQLRQLTARLSISPDQPVAEDATVVRATGWTLVGAHRVDGAPTDWSAARSDCGWPTHSMTVFLWEDPPNWTSSYSASFKPLRSLLPGPSWFMGPGFDRIPLTPIPAGFAINTLFYAAILAQPLSFFPIRRRLRARRGRCPKCGTTSQASRAPDARSAGEPPVG